MRILQPGNLGNTTTKLLAQTSDTPRLIGMMPLQKMKLEKAMVGIESRICAAFEELVARQPIDSISVQAICDKANVSRKTFSRHFGTIQAVVERQIESDFIQPLVDINKLIPPISPSPSPNSRIRS